MIRENGERQIYRSRRNDTDRRRGRQTYRLYRVRETHLISHRRTSIHVQQTELSQNIAVTYCKGSVDGWKRWTKERNEVELSYSRVPASWRGDWNKGKGVMRRGYESERGWPFGGMDWAGVVAIQAIRPSGSEYQISWTPQMQGNWAQPPPTHPQSPLLPLTFSVAIRLLLTVCIEWTHFGRTTTYNNFKTIISQWNNLNMFLKVFISKL